MGYLTICKASAGCGKTYTLAARYVALLLCGNSYRQILAVTFTNKATAEMKQRIIKYLYIIAHRPDTDEERQQFLNVVKGYMKQYKQTDVQNTDIEIRQRAEYCYYGILDNYDEMVVSTIDSFLQMLITGMARMLNIGAGFGVELDSSKVVTEAVNKILTDKQADANLAKILEGYVRDRINDEKGVNMRKDLVKMSENMLNEAVQKEKDAIVYKRDTTQEYKRSIDWRKDKNILRMRELYNKVKDCETNNEIKGGSNFYKFIKRVETGLDGIDSNFDPKKFPEQIATFDKLKDKVADPERAKEIFDALTEMVALCPVCRRVCNTYILTSEKLNDLSLMGAVNDQINVDLQESNSILLARTAYVLSTAMKPGDADFILEKAGIRFKHIMIDEFQDTSELQWDVFKRIIENIMSEGGTALIVGDVKQSIYRWRNSNYTIMSNLAERKDKDLSRFTEDDPKVRNFRSRRNVVDFNLRAFRDLINPDAASPVSGREDVFDEGYAEANLQEYYRNASKEEGYVRLMAVPYKKGTDCEKKEDARQVIVDDMFEQINALIGKGAKAKDMLILIRNNNEVECIYNTFKEVRGDGNHLNLENVRLISNDSFKLKSSTSINIIINALRYYNSKDCIAETYLKLNGIEDMEAFLKLPKEMSLYELMEECVKLLLCDEEGVLKADDSAYVSCLLDNCHSYMETSGSDLQGFLEYWDDTLSSKAIPASDSNGIRVMTIHSAKGLESKNVFVPFCSWKMNDSRKPQTLWLTAKPADSTMGLVPVSANSKMAESEYEQAYQEEMERLNIDAFNLLYVALTRAADNLFVYVDQECLKEDGQKDDNVGYWLLKVKDCNCADEQIATKEFGSTPYINTDKQSAETKQTTPFDEPSYEPDAIIGVDFVSDNKNVQFRQSQESKQFLRYGDEASNERKVHIEIGNICHNILAQIKLATDLNKVLDSFVNRGVISQEYDVNDICQRLSDALCNEQMAKWFDGSYKLMREVSIIKPRKMYEAQMQEWRKAGSRPWEEPTRELRPDRVMIDGNKAIVLDYKFGDKRNDSQYFAQVKDYMHLLQQMGFEEVSGYIWYDCDKEVVPVV